MDRCTDPSHLIITTTLIGVWCLLVVLMLTVRSESLVTVRLKAIHVHCTSLDLDQLRMVETANFVGYKMFHDPHMLWIGAWIHHHSIHSTAFVCPDAES